MSETDNLMDFRRNFYEKFHKVLIPAIEKLEGERKTKLFWAIFWTIVLITAGIAYFYFIIAYKIEGRRKEEPGIYLIGWGLGMYYIFKKNFESKIKQKIMGVVSSCFGNMQWSQLYSLEDAKQFTKAGLFADITRTTIDDAFFGTYKGVAIDIVEGKFINGSGRNSSISFKGLLIKLKMNKNFKGHTILMEDTLFHRAPIKYLRHTELEDIKFEKRYDVFTDDEVEARYILTTTLMERLAGIRMAFLCNKIRCAFYQGELLIAMVPTKDLFSLGSLAKPVTDTKQFERLCDQFISVLNLIDYLKLDRQAVL